MTPLDQARQTDLIERFIVDAREMAMEAGIDPCTFCQTAALMLLKEMIHNEHHACLIGFMQTFYTDYLTAIGRTPPHD